MKCLKIPYASRQSAIDALDAIAHGRKLIAYECRIKSCGMWHVGHKPGKRKREELRKTQVITKLLGNAEPLKNRIKIR